MKILNSVNEETNQVCQSTIKETKASLSTLQSELHNLKKDLPSKVSDIIIKAQRQDLLKSDKDTSNRFNFFVPLTFQKSSDGNGKYLMKIKGIASTTDQDSHEEILDCTGFDCSELLSTGMINWNHNASKTSAAICGKPTAARIIKGKNGSSQLEIEGVIFDNAEGRAVAELIEVLKDEPDRRLGWSIEGKKVSVDPFNPKKITKAVISGVALTHCPVNKNTFVSILKGEYQQPFIQVEKSDIDNLSLHRKANSKSKRTTFKFDHNTFNIDSKNDLDRLSDRLLTEHSNAIEKGRKDDATLFEKTINAIEMQRIVPSTSYKKLAQIGIRLVKV